MVEDAFCMLPPRSAHLPNPFIESWSSCNAHPPLALSGRASGTLKLHRFCLIKPATSLFCLRSSAMAAPIRITRKPVSVDKSCPLILLIVSPISDHFMTKAQFFRNESKVEDKS